MKASRIIEYQDLGLVDKIPPYLRWQSSPPNYLSLGQWSSAHDHVAIYIDINEAGEVVWWAWQFSAGSEGAITRLSPDTREDDEVSARIASELWVRKNYKPVKRQADAAIAIQRAKEEKQAIKDGRQIAGMPAYRFWGLMILGVASIILALLYFGITISPFMTILSLVVTGSLLAIVWYIIDFGTLTLYNWTKRVKTLVKEIK